MTLSSFREVSIQRLFCSVRSIQITSFTEEVVAELNVKRPQQRDRYLKLTISINASQKVLMETHDIEGLVDLVPCGNKVIALTAQAVHTKRI